jgi:hypothetical protein
VKILHLAYRDTSGVPGRWAAAHRAAGQQARLVVELEHPFGYDATAEVRRWTPGTDSAEQRADTIADLLAWADAIMAYEHPFYLETAIISGKPVLYRALGSWARGNPDVVKELLQAGNILRATTGTADLAEALDIELCGAPYPLIEVASMSDRLCLCHAPSDREAKGTEQVLRAAQATGWQVDLIENMANAEVLRRKRHSSLVVDSIGRGSLPDGYGVNGVEAMAMGLPVITTASADTIEQLHAVGSPAVFVEDEAGLRACLRGMRDRRRRFSLGTAGREFVARFHSPAAAAAADLAALAARQMAAA